MVSGQRNLRGVSSMSIATVPMIEKLGDLNSLRERYSYGRICKVAPAPIKLPG